MIESKSENYRLNLAEVMTVIQFKSIVILFILMIVCYVFFIKSDNRTLLYIMAPIVFIANYIAIKTTEEMNVIEEPNFKKEGASVDAIVISFLVLGIHFIDVAIAYGIDWYVFNTDCYTLSYEIIFGSSRNDFIGYCIIVGIVGPVLEEIIFRGKMLKGLYKYGPLSAVIVQAFVFAIMHNVSAFFHAFLIGILYGMYYILTGHILWGIAFHIFNNLVLIPIFIKIGKELGGITSLLFLLMGIGMITIFFLINLISKDTLNCIKDFFRKDILIKEEKKTIISYFTYPMTIVFALLLLSIPT